MKKMKLEVSLDYDSDNAWDLYKDCILDMIIGLDVRIDNSNSKNINIFEGVSNYKKGVEYKNYIDVRCVGYSQSDWDEYKIYFDYSNTSEEFKSIEGVAKELKKIYTHKNDYIVKQIEVLDSGHEKLLNTFYFPIMDIEFPNESDIIYQIDDELIEYDEIEFKLN